jgi:GTP-binding protein HflX
VESAQLHHLLPRLIGGRDLSRLGGGIGTRGPGDGAIAARFRSSRLRATRTRGSRPSSTRSQRRGCAPRTGCSRRSTPPRGA